MSALKGFSIQYMKGVGPARKKLFANLGVESVEDLLYFFPRRYEDRRQLTPIARVQMGEWQTIRGRILTHGARRSWYTRKHVTEIVIDDGTGRMALTWFNQPYLASYFKEGKQLVCYGKVDIYKNTLKMISPEYELIGSLDDENLSMNRIVPIYPLTRGMTQRYIRKIVKACLEKYSNELVDELPVVLRNKLRLANIKRSIHAIHFPEKLERQEEALRRISFEEFYFFQISVILRRLSIVEKAGTAHALPESFISNFMNAFPFELMPAQKRVIQDIRKDMQQPRPMLRLLQGDVGSGKTLVALFGCLAALENKKQAAFMAPTEILARQHYEKISELLLNTPFKKLRIALLIGSLNKVKKEKLYREIANGEVDLIIGTHALIQSEILFKQLSFVVVDEQHKFGVRERSLVTEKGNNPDVLIMTATPIPRTLCLTLYADLDVSIIDEMPKGRGVIKTEHYPEERSPDVYERVSTQVKAGRQAYIVFPIIEESEKLDLKAAETSFQHFKKHEFKNHRLALIHGRLKTQETEEIMLNFKEHKIDILVATTVVEVGLDVPNATVMVIEHAERFGLAQLHQLRGRIGRGQHDALCLLLADPQTPEAQLRIDAIKSTNNGFEISQKDLEIRGPGHYFGRHQHGLNELKVANPATQLDMLEMARQEALELTADDPRLERIEHQRILQVVKRRYPTYLSMVTAG